MTMPRCTDKGSALALLTIFAMLALGGPGSASDILHVGVPGYTSEVFTYSGTRYGPGSGNFDVYIGNWTGTLTNGSNPSQNLSYIYCVDISGVIYVPGTYTTNVTNDGKVYGTTVPNVGKVTALLNEYAGGTGPNLQGSALDKSAALQLAIWDVIYPNSFSVQNFGTDASAVGHDYNVYVNYANSHTATNYSHYQWLSPYDSQGGTTQGLVTGGGPGPLVSTPEPSSLLLFGSLAVGMAGFRWVRRKRLSMVF